jgi:hypothetical protein
MKVSVSAAIALGAALSASVLLSGCGGVGGGGTIKAADVEGEWPLTVDQIKLVCRDDLSIFAEANGKTYALNGQAERNEGGYKVGQIAHIEEIEKADKNASLVPGIKMSLDPVLKAAIAHCSKAGKWKI